MTETITSTAIYTLTSGATFVADYGLSAGDIITHRLLMVLIAVVGLRFLYEVVYAADR